MDSILVPIHRCVFVRAGELPARASLSLEFRREDAACGATSGGLSQRGAKSPLAILNSCPQRLTFPLLRVGTADGMLTLGLLVLILPPPEEAEPRHCTKISSRGSALTQLCQET